jgi:tetrahydromethanopterin S-methyltransferase subunit G
MSNENQEGRLERIEKKIDDMATAMISLARAEEKLLSIEKNNFANYDRMNRFSRKLDEIEKKVDDNARTVAFINKLFWVLVTVASGSIAMQLVQLGA